MKHTLILFFIFCISYSYCNAPRKCDVKLKPLWHALQDTQHGSLSFKGKWIHAGTITFRKKILGPLTIHTIMFDWHGPRIETLDASLYYTEINKPFLAIENNWISDGQWNKHTQKLIFKFKNPCALCVITSFHLVLTVPLDLEPILQKGFFSLSSCYLPEEYQDIQEEQRRLSFGTIPQPILKL